MRKYIKKTLIVSLLLLFCSLFSINVIAETEGSFEPYISTVGDNVASYYVSNVIESQELDFGVKYHNDQGYSIINDKIAHAYIFTGPRGTGKTSTYDIHNIANIEKKIPSKWYDKKKHQMKKEFIDYATPLIQGELTPIFENGLPKHLVRK